MSNLKEKLKNNQKIQELQEDERVQKAIMYAPMTFQGLIMFFLLVPLLSMLIKQDCLAMNRPDYFWPVKVGTNDTEDFHVTNVSKKFKWIFFLGVLVNLASLGVGIAEKKTKEAIKDQRARRKRSYEEEEKLEKKAMNIKYGQVVMFILRVIFFLWSLFGRFRHTGKVCSGDYKRYEILKTGSNYDAAFDKETGYTYLNFGGWVLKMFVSIYLVNISIRAIVLIWYGADTDGDDDDDDDYKRAPKNLPKGIHQGGKGKNDNEGYGGYSALDKKAKHLYDDSPEGSDGSPYGYGRYSPQRGKSQNYKAPDYNNADVFSPQKQNKRKATDYEKKVQEQIERAVNQKTDGRKYSQQKQQPSSKKKLQQQLNQMKY